MKRALLVLGFLQILFVPSLVPAVETAPRITDREIIERLTRLEEGQNTLRAEVRAVEQSLRAEMQANAEAIRQLREDMSTLRADMNTQFARIDAQFARIDAQFARIDTEFGRLINLLVGIVLAFAGLVAATIGFAIWDRRTMIRPFERKVKEIEEDISQNRQRLHSLLEALRTLGQSDDKVAEVLRRFNLL